MRRFALVVALLAVVGLVGVTQAEPMKIGGTCPNFTSLDCACGAKVSLDDFKNDVLVVAITCNHCPAAVAYEDRIINFCKKHCADKNGKVGFVAVNVNNIDADKLDKMKERAQEKGFNFYYAYDPSQQIAKKLGATRTPEFFVFNKERKLVYTGAMDDNMAEDKAKVNHVEEACIATINGETQKTQKTQARGCGIKFDSK